MNALIEMGTLWLVSPLPRGDEDLLDRHWRRPRLRRLLGTQRPLGAGLHFARLVRQGPPVSRSRTLRLPAMMLRISETLLGIRLAPRLASDHVAHAYLDVSPAQPSTSYSPMPSLVDLYCQGQVQLTLSRPVPVGMRELAERPGTSRFTRLREQRSSTAGSWRVDSGEPRRLPRDGPMRVFVDACLCTAGAFLALSPLAGWRTGAFRRRMLNPADERTGSSQPMALAATAFSCCGMGAAQRLRSSPATASTVRAHLERRSSLGGRRTGKKHAHAP